MAARSAAKTQDIITKHGVKLIGIFDHDPVFMYSIAKRGPLKNTTLVALNIIPDKHFAERVASLINFLHERAADGNTIADGQRAALILEPELYQICALVAPDPADVSAIRENFICQAPDTTDILVLLPVLVSEREKTPEILATQRKIIHNMLKKDGKGRRILGGLPNPSDGPKMLAYVHGQM